MIQNVTDVKLPLLVDRLTPESSSKVSSSASKLIFFIAESSDSVPATTRNALPAPRATRSAVRYFIKMNLFISLLFYFDFSQFFFLDYSNGVLLETIKPRQLILSIRK